MQKSFANNIIKLQLTYQSLSWWEGWAELVGAREKACLNVFLKTLRWAGALDCLGLLWKCGVRQVTRPHRQVPTMTMNTLAVCVCSVTTSEKHGNLPLSAGRWEAQGDIRPGGHCGGAVWFILGVTQRRPLQALNFAGVRWWQANRWAITSCEVLCTWTCSQAHGRQKV